MTDLAADLVARWRPTPAQVAEAEAVLADKGGDDGGAVYTLHLLAPKHFGGWSADVVVVPLDGVYPTRGFAFLALEEVASTHFALTGQPVVGGYTRHTPGGTWAVWEDIGSAYPREAR